ncbi:MAG TPA: DinB family protein [Candidatus Limnocylindria bacterium]
MSTSILADAFAHHAWATLRLIDACAAMPPEHLDATVPGTFGSIHATLNHLVASDSWYAFRCTNGDVQAWDDDEERRSLPELRVSMEQQAAAWGRLLERDLDPETMTVARQDDGAEFHAPLGIRLAQVLHHGTDHRSQVCTIMTSLGVEPPAIDVWDYGEQAGRTREVPPPG